MLYPPRGQHRDSWAEHRSVRSPEQILGKMLEWRN